MKFRTNFLFKELHYVGDFLYQKTGVLLKDCYLEQLLTRSSYPYCSRSESNEIYEFYGDAILSHITVKKIYAHYGMLRIPSGNDNDSPVVHILISHERNYTELKNRIVSNEALAHIIDLWAEEGFNILDYMRVGQCDIDNQIEKVRKIKADTFEAIIGAIAIQTKYDNDTLEKAVSKVIPYETIFTSFDKEHAYRPTEYGIDKAISTLQEMSDKGYCSHPKYDGNKDRINFDILPWYVICDVESWNKKVIVYANSKPEAKRAAAYTVLRLQFEQANEYGPSVNAFEWTYIDGKLLPKKATSNNL